MSIQQELSERFLIVENHHTGEILRMRRVRGIDGHTVLVLEGSLPPGTSGPPLLGSATGMRMENAPPARPFRSRSAASSRRG